jgi:hypothetical protein
MAATFWALLTGVYAARILKGEKPGELPVQQSTKVEMFLNLKTAKALGITVPLPLSGRADGISNLPRQCLLIEEQQTRAAGQDRSIEASLK